MAIVSKCPVCKGRGKVRKEVPFGANPKAPATRADRWGVEICQKCGGTGTIGVKSGR